MLKFETQRLEFATKWLYRFAWVVLAIAYAVVFIS
jgi:hypothetical protein